MAKYYVNNRRQDSAKNNNEVHKEGCYWLSKAVTLLISEILLVAEAL